MASKFLMNQAIADAQDIDKAPASVNYNWRDALTGFGNYPDPVQDVTYPNKLQNESFSDLSYVNPESHHPQKFFPQDTSALNYNIHRDPPVDWRENIGINYLDQYPQPFEKPNMLDVSGEVGEYSQKPWETGILAADKAQKQKKSLFDYLPGNVLLSNFAEKFKRPEKMDEAYKAIMGSINPETGRGMYKGKEYRIEGNKIYSELYPYGKNFDSMFGSKSIEEMEDKGYGSLSWARDRLLKGKKISKRLHDILRSRNLLNVRPSDEGAQFGGVDTAAAAETPVTTGGGGVFNPMLDVKGRSDRGQSAAPSWHGATAARQAAGKQVAGPGFDRGAYWAQGGRVGYQGGELVGQETDFIEGPQGGEEFQETVVEGQEQPSREQLEALAMEIFQLPLEELDEQQLLVVYQAAMQQEPMQEDFQENIQFADRGQPMEEDIQEEDVQFAAGGGRIGFRYGGLVSLL